MEKNFKKFQKMAKNAIFGFSDFWKKKDFLGENRTFWTFFRGILEHLERICPKYT